MTNLSTSIVKHATTAPTPPPAGKTIMVHREGEEGGLVISALTGEITTPQDERPAWADGLTVALLAERHGYYSKRLGGQYTPTMQHPDLLNYADLDWLAVDEDGEAVEIEHSGDHRMEVISTTIGFDRETGDVSGKVLAEVEIITDDHRTASELSAYEKSKEVREGIKDGTNG